MMPEMREGKSERFARIATRRVNQILDGMDSLRSCANPAVYSYTDDQVDRIYRCLRSELDLTRDTLYRRGKRFSLTGSDPEDLICTNEEELGTDEN